MRLAIVSLMGGVQWGGSEELWHALARHALDQNDAVLVSIYEWETLHEKLKALQSKGAVIQKRKKFNPNARLFEMVFRFLKNRKPFLNKDYQQIVNFKPDAVFISQGESFDLAIHHRSLYELLQKNKIAYSFVCHSHLQYSFIPPSEIFPAAIEIFQNAQKVYFVSKRQWQITERRLATRIENASFTWNPINLERPPLPLQWPNEEIVCLAIVGSLGGTKGQDTVFEVLSQNKWKARNWKLNIYGTGYGLVYLQSLARFYEIEDKIDFKGHENDILHLWGENHLLLVASAGEGLPISLVEAMACGRPAVVTDVGGNTELIIENETGFIAASPTTSSFAAAMERGWSEKGQWKQLGFNAFTNMKGVLEEKPELIIYNKLIKGS